MGVGVVTAREWGVSLPIDVKLALTCARMRSIGSRSLRIGQCIDHPPVQGARAKEGAEACRARHDGLPLGWVGDAMGAGGVNVHVCRGPRLSPPAPGDPRLRRQRPGRGVG